jgi:membrane-associated phospholipid phosphatase
MRQTLAVVLAVAALCLWRPEPSLAGNRTVERVGDALAVATVAGAYLSTFARGDPEGRPQFTKGFLLNLGTTYALKFAIDKERPDASGNDSFPSAHASIAFQGGSFLQFRYGWRWGAPALAAAAAVGWTRVAADKHDPVDVLAGAVIGGLSGALFTKPFGRVVVEPVAGGGTYGARLAFTW